jgi:hypothetical protein
MKRSWAVWFVIILFFVGTTFAAVMLYYVAQLDTFLGLGSICYLILTWIFTFYVLLKRETFETSKA